MVKRMRASGHVAGALFLAGTALAVLFLSALALAEPPAQKMTQIPGVFRMALGSFEVTAVYDGFALIKPSLLKGVKEKDVAKLLDRAFIDPATGMPTSVNAFLVNTGTNLVLVDTGAGAFFGSKAGFLPDNICAAGYDPAQVDTVLLTHLHSDHVLGLVDKEGRMVFPNAVVRVAQADADYWLGEEVAAKAPDERKPFFKALGQAVAPYAAAGKLKTFAPGDTLLPGVDAVPLTGHTPGHFGFLFSSGGQSLLAWGDIIHSHAVQFSRPEVSIDFDTDQKQAVATRKKALAEAAKGKYYVAGAHIPFPGIGHVRAEKRGYAWVPVEFGPVGGGR